MQLVKLALLSAGSVNALLSSPVHVADKLEVTNNTAAHKFAKQFKHFANQNATVVPSSSVAAKVAKAATHGATPSKPVQMVPVTPTAAPHTGTKASQAVHLKAKSKTNKVTSAVGAHRSKARTAGGDDKEEGCGGLTTFPNAKPKDYRNARKTKYDTEKKKQVDITFAAGDTVEFECETGFTVDGAADGDTVFDVECLEQGYYEPKATCVAASKCGPLPEIPHAAPTGKSHRGKVEFACGVGFSLDGEKVVAGGEGKNSHFELECIEFKGRYAEFRGECQSYAFMPAHEVTAMYNQVFEALFIASCKGTLKKDFGKSGEPPAGLDTACAQIKIGDASKCDSLVTQIKDDFKTQKEAKDEHDKEKKKDWFEEKDPERPNINDEATTFCTDLWKVLKVQEGEK